MGKQVTQTFRGQCFSKDKVRKDGQPKRAGNFSAYTHHVSSLQTKDYRVYNRNGVLIVGDHTPLSTLFPAELLRLIMSDENFRSYRQEGKQAHNGKGYDARRILERYAAYGAHMYCDFEYLLRLEIYTDYEFTYEFPEY